MDDQYLIKVIQLEPIFPHFGTCCICECEVQIFLYQPNYGIPMYEDLPVPPEWDGEWGGFCACKECHDKYDRGELEMWTIEQLQISQQSSNTTHSGGMHG